jgi:hypothetical protein
VVIASFAFRASLLAAGLVACAAGPCLAESRLSATPTAAARLMFQVQVPAVARVLPTGLPGLVTVTPDDLERGFVEVAGTGIEVVANQRGEKRLVASLVAGFAKAVEIIGLPQALVAEPQGEVGLREVRRGVVDSRYDLRYRIHLDRTTPPGTYPWPVFLRVEVR